MLREKGDAELIVKQVRGRYVVRNDRMKHYKNRVWDEIEGFQPFFIDSIPREKNSRIDALAGSTTILIPHLDFDNDQYTIELIHQPNVLDNANSWQVFNDDAHVLSFLQGMEEFSSIFFKGSKFECQELCSDEKVEKEEEVIQLKGNHIPKGLVNMGKLFDHKDSFIGHADGTKEDQLGSYEKINIESNEDPKFVNLGMCCSPIEKEVFTKLL